MTASSSSSGAGAPAGPVVAVCTGHRCAALRRLDGEDDALGASLREAVRASRGGVLVSSPCVGACARAPVAAVGQREEGQAQPAAVVWLGDLDRGRREALAAWVGDLAGATAPTAEARAAEAPAAEAPALPPALRGSVLGVRSAGPGHRRTSSTRAHPAPPG